MVNFEVACIVALTRSVHINYRYLALEVLSKYDSVSLKVECNWFANQQLFFTLFDYGSAKVIDMKKEFFEKFLWENLKNLTNAIHEDWQSDTTGLLFLCSIFFFSKLAEVEIKQKTQQISYLMPSYLYAKL
jgi:hypothetical protein